MGYKGYGFVLKGHKYSDFHECLFFLFCDELSLLWISQLQHKLQIQSGVASIFWHDTFQVFTFKSHRVTQFDLALEEYKTPEAT